MDFIAPGPCKNSCILSHLSISPAVFGQLRDAFKLLTHLKIPYKEPLNKKIKFSFNVFVAKVNTFYL